MSCGLNCYTEPSNKILTTGTPGTPTLTLKLSTMDSVTKEKLLALAGGIAIGSIVTYFAARPAADPPIPTDVTLTYWAGRGKAEIIRLTLAAVGVTFKHQIPGLTKEDIFLNDPSHFVHLRSSGYLVANQVPLLVMDGVNYVQSMATVRMIAARFHFDGKSSIEKSAVDIASEICLDYKNAVGSSWEFGMGGVAPTEEIRAKVRRGNEKYLPVLESMLMNRTWLASEQMSYGECVLAAVCSLKLFVFVVSTVSTMQICIYI